MRMATKTTKRRMMMIRMMVMMMLVRMRTTMMMMISREDKIDQRWLTSNQRLYIGWPGIPLFSCLSALKLILGIKFLLLIIIIVILIISLHYLQN